MTGPSTGDGCQNLIVDPGEEIDKLCKHYEPFQNKTRGCGQAQAMSHVCVTYTAVTAFWNVDAEKFLLGAAIEE